MKSTGKFLIAGLTGALIALQGSPVMADISPDDFQKAMDAYLKTDKGKQEVGKVVQGYFQQQQERARAAQQKQQQAALEAQFKNPVKVDVGNSPSKGPKDAPITIVEFSDFECPFCARGANTVEDVLKAYPDKVRVVFKNLPLPFHKRAEPAAKAALAAGKQGKFWEMHDKLFKNQRGLTDTYINKCAEELKLDLEKFKADMKSDEIDKQIKDDKAQASKIGISGTPGFSVNGVLVKGAYPVDHFKMIIDRWLEKKDA